MYTSSVMKMRIKLPLLIILSEILILTFLIPPFQKNDEPIHFFRIYSIIQGKLWCPHGDDLIYVPHSIYEFPRQMGNLIIAGHPEVKFPVSFLTMTYPYSDTMMTGDKGYAICNLSPLAYIPLSIIFKLSLIFNNLVISFYLIRITASIIFAICLIFSLRVSPRRYQPIILAFACIPTVIHQVTSVNIDYLLLSLTMILFAYFVKTFSNFNLHRFLLLNLFVILFQLVKPAYYAYIILPLMLLRIPKSINQKKFSLIIILFTLLLTSRMIFGLRQISQLTSPDILSSSQAQAQFILQAPVKYSQIIIATIHQYGLEYLRQMIGKFGWIELYLDAFAYILIGITATVVINHLLKTVPQKFPLTIIFTVTGISLITSALIFTGLYLSFNTVGNPIIEGVQGRYFLPLVPFWLLATVNAIAFVRDKGLTHLIYVLTCITIIGNISLTLYQRYFDYNQMSITNPTQSKPTSNTTSVSLQEIHTFHLASDPSYPYIAGFSFDLPKAHTTTILYQYKLKNSQCSHTLGEGLLDIKSFTLSTHHQIALKHIINNSQDYCLVIEPFIRFNGAHPLIISTKDNQPPFTLIYSLL